MRREAEQLLENALDGYAKSKSDKAKYYSARSAIFLAHTLASKNMYKYVTYEINSLKRLK